MPNLGKIKLPWAVATSDSNLPHDFAFDVKKEDGWKMLFHTLTSESDPMKYIGLYNQRTGMMKIFFYLNNDNFSNNTGAWELTFTSEQEFLNHLGELAIPKELGKINFWGCSNAVRQTNKAFYLGWNGFQVPLAYSPNTTADRRMDISSHCLNITDANLFGNTYSHSQGTILTHGSSNPLSGLTSDMVSLFGKDAENAIDKEIKEGKFKEKSGSSRSLLGGIAGAVVKYGVNKVFNKLTASFSQPTATKSDLEFSTTGTVNITGNLSFNSNSPAISLRVAFNKNYVGEVGVWNLADQPVMYMDPRADHVPDEMDATYKEYIYELRGVSRYGYNLLINPELTPYIIDKWVKFEPIRYWNPDANAPEVPDIYSFGTLGGRGGGFSSSGYETQDLIYGTGRTDGAIYDEHMHYTLRSKMDIYSQYGGPIKTVYVPKTSYYGNTGFDSENIFLKMSLYLVTEFEGKRDTTISTRTFIPKIEWDPRLCDALKNIPMNTLHNYNGIK